MRLLLRALFSWWLAVPLTALAGSAPAGDRDSMIAARQAPKKMGKRYALLIAMSKYTHYNHRAVKPLRGPENDVRALEARLKSPRCGFDEVLVFSEVSGETNPAEAPTVRNIKLAVERLVAKARSEDLILVVLSGHAAHLIVHPPR